MSMTSPVSSVWSMSPMGSPVISDVSSLTAISQDSNLSYGMHPGMPLSKQSIPRHSSTLHSSSFTSVSSMSLGSSGSVDSPKDSHLVNTTPSVTHVCAICGDRALGKKYEVYSCEGCKGFFEGTVCKDLKYSCEGYCSCHIDKYRRNCCAYCPHMKCLEMGMKLTASYDGKCDRTDRSHLRMIDNENMVLDNTNVNSDDQDINDAGSNRNHRPRIYQADRGNSSAASGTETDTSVLTYPQRDGGKKTSVSARFKPNQSTVSGNKTDEQSQPELSIQSPRYGYGQSHGQRDPIKSN